MAFASLSKPQPKKAAPIKRGGKRKRASIPIHQVNPGSGFGAGFQPLSLPIQAKLKIGEPNDKYEQEAYRVADIMMRRSNGRKDVTPLPQETGQYSPQANKISTPRIQRLCSKCSAEEDHTIQRASISSDIAPAKKTKENNAQPSLKVGSQAYLIPGGSQPLPSTVRTFFEPRFGFDFSQVRIHADRYAHNAARSINAKAFTLGKDIVFGAGEYQPESNRGKRLLAHELTHVIQQNSISRNVIQRAPGPPPVPGPPPEELPDPDIECRVGIAALFRRVLSGDEAAATKILDCCAEIPVGGGCTSQVVAAAQKLLKKRRGSGKRDPAKCSLIRGFRAADSPGLEGQCCEKGTVANQNCCFPVRITKEALFPECCLPPQEPDHEKKKCVDPPSFVPKPLGPVSPKTPTPKGTQKPSRLSPMVIFFFFDSTIRRPESNTGFDILLSILKAIPRLRVQITGHTSQEGSAEYNLQLGQKRADAIQSELVIAGIDRSRITTLSLGKSVPAVPEPPVEGSSPLPGVEDIRNQNRRVEVAFIDPKGEFAPSTPPVTLRKPELRLPAPRPSLSLGNPQLKLM